MPGRVYTGPVVHVQREAYRPSELSTGGCAVSVFEEIKKTAKATEDTQNAAYSALSRIKNAQSMMQKAGEALKAVQQSDDKDSLSAVMKPFMNAQRFTTEAVISSDAAHEMARKAAQQAATTRYASIEDI